MPLRLKLLNKAIREVEKCYEDREPGGRLHYQLMLDWLLKLTESEYGYIGYHKRNDKTGQLFLQTVVISDVAWNDEIRAQYLDVNGTIKLQELNSLFGEVIKTGKPCLSNSPRTDPRACRKLPKGHPILHSFLGLPLRVGNRVVGSVGVANRPGGYVEEIIDFVRPFLAVCGNQIAIASLDDSAQVLKEQISYREDVNTDIKWLGRVADRLRMETSVAKICEIANEALYEYLYPAVFCSAVILEGCTPVISQKCEQPEKKDVAKAARLLSEVEDFPKDVYSVLGLDKATHKVDQVEVGNCEDSVPMKLIRILNFREAQGLLLAENERMCDEVLLHLVARLSQVYYTENMARLITEKQAALQASQMKSDFLATMSHEIRTPLNGILGILDILAESELSEYQEKLVQSVLQSSELLSTVLNDILDYSKLESHKIQLEIADFSLHSVIHYLRVLFDNAASSKGITLEFQVSKKTPPYVKSDRIRISQILSNLISNAIKFTDSGQVTTVVDYDESRTHLVIDVSDSGIGISEAQSELLFQSFQQVEPSICRRFGGTGLGLVISKNLAALLGGTLELKHSEFGVGSTFRFTFPFVPGTATGEDTPEDCLEFSLRNLKVLVAEDNMINQKLVKLLLKGAGVDSPVLVGNGKLALEAAMAQHFDLILMDLHMPILNGFQSSLAILEHYKEQGTKPPVIVAVTADAFEETKMRCIEAGITGFIRKPFRKANFIQELTAITERMGLPLLEA